MKYKNTIVYLLVIIILLSTLVGCKGKDTDVQGDTLQIDGSNFEEIEPVEGGIVSIPLTNFNTLNPLLTDNSSYYHFSKLIFDGIFEFDNNLEPILKLGESYKITEGGKNITINLKKGIKWHDGQPLTALDIEFTIDAIKKAKLNSTYGKVFKESVSIDEKLDLKTFINTNIIDENNIEIIFDREFANVLEILTFPIIPRHAFANIEAALDIEDYKPIGTGPFKFIEYEKFKTVNLVKNEDYWNGPIYIEGITGNVLDNNKLILTSFETGQIDFAFSMDVDWDKYRQNHRIKVYEYASSDYEFLGFNFKNDRFTEEQGLAIRRAMAFGIDRQNIIQNLYLGHGTQIDVPLHPNSFLIDEIADKYGYNINFAKEELEKVGYIDRDGDGIVEDIEGNPLEITILTNTSNLFRLRTAEIIIEDLRKIGIDMTFVENIPKDKLIIEEDKNKEWDIMQSNLEKGNFDIALLGWKTSVIPNISYMFHSSKLNKDNYINYSDEKMDILLESSLNSSVKRKQENYRELQKHILEELPYISLFYKNQALLVDSGIIGELNPNFFNLYNGLEKCFILENDN